MNNLKPNRVLLVAIILLGMISSCQNKNDRIPALTPIRTGMSIQIMIEAAFVDALSTDRQAFVFEGGENVAEDAYYQYSIGRVDGNGYIENYLHGGNQANMMYSEVEVMDMDQNGEKEIVVQYYLEGAHSYGSGRGGWWINESALEIRSWTELDTLLFVDLYHHSGEVSCGPVDEADAYDPEAEWACVEDVDSSEFEISATLLPKENLIQLDTVHSPGDTTSGKYFFDSKTETLKKAQLREN